MNKRFCSTPDVSLCNNKKAEDERKETVCHLPRTGKKAEEIIPLGKVGF